MSPEQLREYRLQKEAEYFRSEIGFLDFVRESGAAPDAEYQPHGRYCQDLITWHGDPDPDNPEITNYRSKLTLWPRGSFKSQVFNVGQVAWLIARDPDIRVLVCSETARQARKFVRETMKIVDSEWFRERFGVHRSNKAWKEGEGSFTSALRTRRGVKDPTLAAAGVGEVQTGAHWDFVLMDDVCSQENTKTPESIESLWNWFGEVQSQLDPGTKLFMIGTLHHFADLYCRIMKEPEIRKTFDISKHAWCTPLIDPNSNEDTELFFPSRLTRRFVADRKAKQTRRLFACFYENRPFTDDQQIFKDSFFRVIRDEDVPQHVWTYIYTDFAFIAEEKKKGHADRTVFWVVSLDCNRVAYVRDIVIGRWKPSDSVRIACDLWDRYQHLNVKGITVEDTAHKELISSLFEEIRRNTFIRPKIIPIQGRSQEVKDIRIEAIEPRFRNGDIYFTQSVRENHFHKWKPMIEEMTEWPFSKHDDIPDALSDLDKRDRDDKFYTPAPPPGWRQASPFRHRPTTIDGRFNPEYGYDARQFTRAQQQGNDLWQRSSDRGEGGLRAVNSDIFQRRPPSAKPPGRS